MDKYELLGKIADIYAKGGNILEYLRAIEGRDDNTIEDWMNLINLSWLWWK